MNPMTAKFYPSMVFSDGHDASELSEWPKMVEQYVSTLNDTSFVKRLCYRSAMLHGLSKRLRHLDGLAVDEKEREKAEGYYARLKTSFASQMRNCSPLKERAVPHPLSQVPSYESTPMQSLVSSYESTPMKSAHRSLHHSEETQELLRRVSRLKIGTVSPKKMEPRDQQRPPRKTPETFWVSMESGCNNIRTELPALPPPPKPLKYRVVRPARRCCSPVSAVKKSAPLPPIRARSTIPRPIRVVERPALQKMHKYVVYSSTGKPMVLSRPAEDRGRQNPLPPAYKMSSFL